MNIAIVYFSFSKDKALLLQSLRAIPRLTKDGRDTITTFVFDDASSTIGPEPFAGTGVRYSTTDFPRCGNLNGTACVLGMYTCFRNIFDTLSPDWIIKVDSDVFINDLEFLRNLDPTTVGGSGTFSELHFAHGCLYAVSAYGLSAIESQLARDDIIKRMDASTYLANEDRMFSLLMRMGGARQFRLEATNNPLSHGRGCYQDFDWASVKRRENPSYDDMLKHCGVSFKTQTYSTRSEAERDANRADALTRITAYADFAVEQPLRPIEKTMEERVSADETPDEDPIITG